MLVKTAQFLEQKPFSNMNLLLKHREENIKEFLREKSNYNQVLATSLQFAGRTSNNWPFF